MDYLEFIARMNSHIPDKGQVMIRKVYEVDPLRCSACVGQMRIISFIEETKTIDRIVRHLELTFEAERPPPPHQQELFMAAEEKGLFQKNAPYGEINIFIRVFTPAF